MAFYRIGEFCKEYGISPETLKYYDRQGVLAPVWKDETSSYRYYGEYQTVHLAEYYRLSQMGFSLNESKEILQNASLEEVIQKFTKRREELSHEIQDQKFIYDALGKMMEALRLVGDEEENWYLLPMKNMYYAYHVHEKKTAGFTWWKDLAPFPETWQRVQEEIPSDFSYSLKNYQRTWGVVVTKERADTLIQRAGSSMHVEPIPDCRAFTYYHSVPARYDDEKKLADKVWDFEGALMMMKKHHLFPRGDFYQQRICVTHEKDCSKVHMVTHIPLR